jgi:hypothetical protein
MPTNRETGKDRWRRIPKEYFKKRDRLQSLKLQFSALAFIGVIAWWASGIDWKGGTDVSASTDLNGLRANHGELARVHTAWANQCNACHVPFEPIDGRGLFATTSAVDNRSSDKLCMTCHAGPAHHSTTIDSEVKTCAGCHHDHQGADFSLVRMKDNECTSCHQNLTAHIASGTKAEGSRKYENIVKQFNAANHPAFHPEGAKVTGEKLEDKSRLKFNHARHMMPGIVKKPGDIPYKIEDIPLVAERGRYQKTASLQEAVQLDCASCHVLDSTEIKGGSNPTVASVSLPARSSGKYYLPATFETSCRACHTLTVVAGAKPLEVPHGVQTDQVEDFLKKSFAAQILSDDPKILDSYVPASKIPGKPAVEATVREKRDKAVKAALKSLFPEETQPAPGVAGSSNANNCVECHYYGPLDPQGIPTRVEPTRVPEIWFTHAVFDHTAHRGVSCRDCHAKAYAFEADGKTVAKDASWSGTDYLNPGLDNCVQCHAPARQSGGFLGMGVANKMGGVSADCTECHRYHNGDNVLQGYGATAQDATAHRTISQFLSATGGEAVRTDPAKSGKP